MADNNKVEKPSSQEEIQATEPFREADQGDEPLTQKERPERVRFSEQPTVEILPEKSVINQLRETHVAERAEQTIGGKDDPEKTCLMDPSAEPQVVIQNMESNIMEDVKRTKPQDKVLVDVDWLGVPLSKATLPDYVSMTKMHFPGHSPYTLMPPGPYETSKEATKDEKRDKYEMFYGLDWVPESISPSQVGGYVKMKGQLSKVMLHPSTHRWEVPPPVLARIKKKDPAEYLNLCDPQNKIPFERAMYQWILEDKAAMDERFTVGMCERTSGYSKNRLPHHPDIENRDFVSIYKDSFCTSISVPDIEGLHPSLQMRLEYPGYVGGQSMRDQASSFVRYAPHVLKTKHDLLERHKSYHKRIMSAKPIP